MGTKIIPGAFYGYDKADCDEPMFVLLGQDRDAAVLVNLWAHMRLAREGQTAQVIEARQCANAMVDYLYRVKPDVTPSGVRTAIEALVALAQEVGCVVTVDQEPLQPLAMGHCQHRVHVRPAR